MFGLVSDNIWQGYGASLLILDDKWNLCFEDGLSPQHATFFPLIISDNIPVMFILHRCLYKNMQSESQCNLAGSISHGKFLSSSKSDCHKQV